MHLKIVIALLAFIPTYSTLAADNLLSMQQKYGFKMCQKMTSEIKRGSKLICSAKDYKEYLKDGFYDCTLTNKKMGLTVMSYRNKVSDITFYNIFNVSTNSINTDETFIGDQIIAHSFYQASEDFFFPL